MKGSLVNYRSFHDMIRLVRSNINELPNDFDLVVGIPRSGLIPADMIALLKHLPLTDINGLINQTIYPAGDRMDVPDDFFEQPLRILIVDDSINKGGQLKVTKEELAQHLGNKPYQFFFLTIYATPASKHKVDFCFETVPLPRVFSWNLLQSWIYKESCVDLDGVLCKDPTEEENDDGERYLHFIENAPPLHLPSEKIKYIITSRLERYRAPTEAWLEKHGVVYDKLYMLDLPTAEERRRLMVHAKFKADIYSKTDTILFIESARWQAAEINAIAQKPVFCVETHEMFEHTSWEGRLQYRYRQSRSIFRRMPQIVRRLAGKALGKE